MAKQQEIIISDGLLTERIYRLRDENIMLDRDLTDLYGVKAIRLREQDKTYGITPLLPRISLIYDNETVRNIFSTKPTPDSTMLRSARSRKSP